MAFLTNFFSIMGFKNIQKFHLNVFVVFFTSALEFRNLSSGKEKLGTMIIIFDFLY